MGPGAQAVSFRRMPRCSSRSSCSPSPDRPCTAVWRECEVDHHPCPLRAGRRCLPAKSPHLPGVNSAVGSMGASRRHVLVVEDDADTCHLLVEMLRDAGYSAECRMTTAAALEHLRDRPTDLVIADLLMGDEDGRSFLELRRGDP